MMTRNLMAALVISVVLSGHAYGQSTKVKTPAPTTNTSKTHYVRKPHTKVAVGRPLFTYPNPHPAYIVTYTMEDMKQFNYHGIQTN